MNLVIDIGNSSIKGAVFASGEMVSSSHWDNSENEEFRNWLSAFPEILHAIVSTVRKNDAGISDLLVHSGISVISLDDRTPLPIHNRYRSSSTLGRDRIASAVGANLKFPGQDLLIIDAGTAITIDILTSGNEYLGGNISPGLSMRFRALHEFTQNLPRVIPGETRALYGDDTTQAIRAGVQYGIIFELDEYINRQKIRYPDLKVIMTGGDAVFFDKKLKNSIFVDLNLIMYGLNRILDYNVES